MKLMIEIRAAEGGDDAKLLVGEMAGIYLRYANIRGTCAEVSEHVRLDGA